MATFHHHSFFLEKSKQIPYYKHLIPLYKIEKYFAIIMQFP